MSLFSVVRGLWWVGSEVVDAARQLLEFRPGQDLAERLAEYEAGAECLEAQACPVHGQWCQTPGPEPWCRQTTESSAAPGVSPVEAADKDPGAHPPTRAPGSQTSAGTADDHPFWLPRGELAKALRDAHNAYSRATWDEKFYEALADAAINFFGQDLASVHARTMRQRQGEDRE